MTYSKCLLLWPPFPMVHLSNGGGSSHCSQAQAWEGWAVHSGIWWRVKRRRKRPELKEIQFLLVQSLVCLFSVGKLGNLGCCQYYIWYLKNNSAFANLGCLAILYMLLANVRIFLSQELDDDPSNLGCLAILYMVLANFHIFLSQELDVDPSLYPILAEPSFRTSRTHHLVIQPIVTERSKAMVNTACSLPLLFR